MKKGLHGMRGIMSLAILLSHCGYLAYYKPTEVIGRYFVYLYGAVTFFFILSGYFFKHTVRKETFQIFVLRKIRKIYPIHICTLVCSLAILLYRGQVSFKKDAVPFLANLFLLQSWIPVKPCYFSFNAVSWFLSSLLACYILAYCIYKWKISLHWVVVVGYTLQIMLCIILQEPHHWLLYINPLARIIDFCFGICICQRIGHGKCRSLSKWIYTMGEFFSIGLFIGAVYTAKIIKVNWTYNCIWIIPSASIITLFSIEKGVLSEILSKAWFQKIGNISMELFMTHKFIINNVVNTPWFIKLGNRNALLSLILILSCCFAVAIFTQWMLVKFRCIFNIAFGERAKEEINK